MTLVDGLFRKNQVRMRWALQSRGSVRETEKQQVDGSTSGVKVKGILIRATSQRAMGQPAVKRLAWVMEVQVV